MPKKIIHDDYPWPDEPIKGLKRVADFLPKPQDLVFRVKKEAITFSISSHSLSFYRQYAKKHKIAFKDMLGAVLDAYAERALAK